MRLKRRETILHDAAYYVGQEDGTWLGDDQSPAREYGTGSVKKTGGQVPTCGVKW